MGLFGRKSKQGPSHEFFMGVLPGALHQAEDARALFYSVLEQVSSTPTEVVMAAAPALCMVEAAHGRASALESIAVAESSAGRLDSRVVALVRQLRAATESDWINFTRGLGMVLFHPAENSSTDFRVRSSVTGSMEHELTNAATTQFQEWWSANRAECAPVGVPTFSEVYQRTTEEFQSATSIKG